MKIGIDLHGTIDSNPELFSVLIWMLREEGNEIHITTGIKGDLAREKIANLGIEYDHLFSITDYHVSIGTEVVYDENDEPWIEEITWNRSKGDYCKREGLEYHIDDTEVYEEYFEGTEFVLFDGDSELFMELYIGKMLEGEEVI